MSLLCGLFVDTGDADFLALPGLDVLIAAGANKNRSFEFFLDPFAVLVEVFGDGADRHINY